MAAAGTDQARPEYRAALAASQMIGLALTRYVLALGPIASVSADDLAAAIGPTLERYLTGDIPAPGGEAPGGSGAPGGDGAPGGNAAPGQAGQGGRPPGPPR